MLLSLNWIGRFVSLDGLSPEELADKLTLHTAEMEEVIYKGADLDSVLVAEITAVRELKPGYHIVTINAGQQTEVICTDTALQVGEKVPYAPVGSVLNGVTTGVKQVGDFTSQGFLLSEKELDISTDESKVFRIDNSNAAPGMKITEVYPYFKDVLLNLDNKSVTHRPDLWGIYGFAREVAAIYKRELKPLDLYEDWSGQRRPAPKVTIEPGSGCNRYMGVALEGVQNGPAPLELRTLLHYAGYKSLNLIVDLANFVMAETGQPLHTFDLDKSGDTIIVDRAKAPVPLALLDGETAEVPEGAIMILDGDRQPLAVAGVMGSEGSKVTEGTHSVLLEAANFDANAIRTTANRLKRRTEAASRFEKSLVVPLAEEGLKRYCRLLQELQGGVAVSAVADVDLSVTQRPEIRFSLDFVRTFSGVAFEASLVSDILNRLGFTHTLENGQYSVTVPWFRSAKDISIPPDVVEEITRIYGYDNIVPEAPALSLAAIQPNALVETEYAFRRVMSYVFGYTEVRTYAWHDKRWLEEIGYTPENVVQLINPRTVFQDMMKDNLVPALLQLAEGNMRQQDAVQLYELAPVFTMGAEPGEKRSAAGVSYQKGGDLFGMFTKVKTAVTYLLQGLRNRKVIFKDNLPAPAKVWMNERSLVGIYVDEVCVGSIAVLATRLRQKFFRNEPVVVFELDVDAIKDMAPQKLRYVAPPQFPPVPLEFNIVADEREKYLRIVEIVNSYQHPFIREVQFRELYRDAKRLPGQTSYLFLVEIGSDEKTLEAGEINGFKDGFIDYIRSQGLALR